MNRGLVAKIKDHRSVVRGPQTYYVQSSKFISFVFIQFVIVRALHCTCSFQPFSFSLLLCVYFTALVHLFSFSFLLCAYFTALVHLFSFSLLLCAYFTALVHFIRFPSVCFDTILPGTPKIMARGWGICPSSGSYMWGIWTAFWNWGTGLTAKNWKIQMPGGDGGGEGRGGGMLRLQW